MWYICSENWSFQSQLISQNIKKFILRKVLLSFYSEKCRYAWRYSHLYKMQSIETYLTSNIRQNPDIRSYILPSFSKHGFSKMIGWEDSGQISKTETTVLIKSYFWWEEKICTETSQNILSKPLTLTILTDNI